MAWVTRWWRRWFGAGDTEVGPTPHTLVARVQSLESHQEQRMLRVAEEALRRGHPDQAIIAYQMAAARFRMMGQRLKESVVLHHLARLQPEEPEPLRELVDVYDDIGRQREAASVRLRLAALLRKRGQAGDADRVERTAEAVDVTLGDDPLDDDSENPEMPGDPVDIGEVERERSLEIDINLDAFETAEMAVPGSARPRGSVGPRDETVAFEHRDLYLGSIRDDFDDGDDPILDGHATLAMPAVDYGSTDTFEPDETAAMRRAPSAAGRRVDDERAARAAGPAVDRPHAMPSARRPAGAITTKDPTVSSRAGAPPSSRWDDEALALEDRPPPLDADLAEDLEDTDAVPLPTLVDRSASHPAEATVMDGLPAALAEQKKPLPNEKTRAYGAEDLRQLKKLLDKGS